MREELPSHRSNRTFAFDYVDPKGAVFPVCATLGLYPDGLVGEVFINGGKLTTSFDVACRDAAILLSFALQHGARVPDIAGAMTRDAAGRAEGVIGQFLDLVIAAVEEGEA